MSKSTKKVKTLTENLTVSGKKVKTLTKNLAKLKVTFNRASYRAAYDKVYFKQRVECTRCGASVVKHMLKRHMSTRKCTSIRVKKQGEISTHQNQI